MGEAKKEATMAKVGGTIFMMVAHARFHREEKRRKKVKRGRR
jgi:hypothetical protein